MQSNENIQHGAASSRSAGSQNSSAIAEELSRNLSLAIAVSAGGAPAPLLPAGTSSSQVSGTLNSEHPMPNTASSSSNASADNSSKKTGSPGQVEPSETQSSSSDTGERAGAASRPSSAASVSATDDDAQSSKKKPAKKDRSKLRKGKWTVEEEEYTTRIIHHFSTGLLTLPEGATLRSFLADKLNCDPMRITKKFAGASCLGRRVFHLRNRPQPSYEEIQMARMELDQLEQRFRLRVEHGYGGMPLTNTPGMMLKFATPDPASSPAAMHMSQRLGTAAPSQAGSAAAAASGVANGTPNAAATAAAASFLQNFAALAAASGAPVGSTNPVGTTNSTHTFPFQLPSSAQPTMSATSSTAPGIAPSSMAPNPAAPSLGPAAQAAQASQLATFAGVPSPSAASAAQFLLPNPSPGSAPSATAAVAPTGNAPSPAVVDASVRAVNDAVTGWAWAQVAASLSGALPQMSASNLQQQQRQQLMASLAAVFPHLAAAGLQPQQSQVQPQAPSAPQQQGQQAFQHRSLQSPQQQPQTLQPLQPSQPTQSPLQAHLNPAPAPQGQQLQQQPSSQTAQQTAQQVLKAQQEALQRQHIQALQKQQDDARKKQEDQAKMEAKQKETAKQAELLQKAHADDANSFALQLREAYEKQLKAREAAEAGKSMDSGTKTTSVARPQQLRLPAPPPPSKSQSKGSSIKSGKSSKTKSSKTKASSSKVKLIDGKVKESAKTKDKKKIGGKAKAAIQPGNGEKPHAKQVPSKKADKVSGVAGGQKGTHNSQVRRTDEDQAAGTILMGFLSSLRDSYEDALRNKGSQAASIEDAPVATAASSVIKSSQPKKKEAQKKVAAAKKIKKRPRQENESSSKKQKLEQTPKISNSSSSKPVKSVVVAEGGSVKAKTTTKIQLNMDKKPEPITTQVPAPASATSSLADSYRQFTAASLQTKRTTPAYITDQSTSETSSGNNSTNPVESSLEDSDSNSDKYYKEKADPSSSDDDDKVEDGNDHGKRYRSKGPPRKRIKASLDATELAQNVSESN